MLNCKSSLQILLLSIAVVAVFCQDNAYLKKRLHQEQAKEYKHSYEHVHPSYPLRAPKEPAPINEEQYQPESEGHVYAHTPENHGHVYAHAPESHGHVYVHAPENHGQVHEQAPENNDNVYEHAPENYRPAYSSQSIIHHPQSSPQDSEENKDEHVSPVYQYVQEENEEVNAHRPTRPKYQTVHYPVPAHHEEHRSKQPQKPQPHYAQSHEGFSFHRGVQLKQTPEHHPVEVHAYESHDEPVDYYVSFIKLSINHLHQTPNCILTFYSFILNTK